MSNVILQPSGNKDGREHYVNTIKSPVSLDRILRFVSTEDANKIRELYPNGKVYVWGVTNGANDGNVAKWDKISVGDVTLFFMRGGAVATAVTTYKFHNKDLALDLWDVDANGNTWENIYLVDEVKNVNIPYERFNEAAGYSPNYIVQGFNVLNEEKSSRILNAFDLFSSTYSEEISEATYTEVIDKLSEEESLDILSKTTARKEQTFLRTQLFKGKRIAKCGICNKTYPIDLLITSHIKKRCDCTKEEKLDYKNVVIPMCKFGCDDLYEKGYIAVLDGKVVISQDKYLTPEMTNYLNSIKGTPCSYWNDNSKDYFIYHAKKYNFEV